MGSSVIPDSRAIFRIRLLEAYQRHLAAALALATSIAWWEVLGRCTLGRAAAIAQLDDWLPSPAEVVTCPDEAILLHADVKQEHILGLVEAGRFTPTGVIDFNRARIGHPLYELGPIWAWVFHGQRPLIDAFLDEAALPGRDDPGFPRLALAWCLLHEGVIQDPIELPGIHRVDTLEELAERSFGGVETSGMPGSSPRGQPVHDVDR